jgi:hypothetical protein
MCGDYLRRKGLWGKKEPTMPEQESKSGRSNFVEQHLLPAIVALGVTVVIGIAQITAVPDLNQRRCLFWIEIIVSVVALLLSLVTKKWNYVVSALVVACLLIYFLVQVPNLPDLIVVSTESNQKSPDDCSNPPGLKATIKNQGSAPAEDGFCVSLSNGATDYKPWWLESLAAGAQEQFVWEDVPPGPNGYTVEVDSEHSVKEEDEENNKLGREVEVIALPICTPIPTPTPIISIEAFTYIEVGDNSQILSSRGIVTVTTDAVLYVTAVISPASKGEMEELVFDWDTGRGIVREIRGSTALYVAPAEPGLDFISVVIVKAGEWVSEDSLFVDVK